MSLSLLGPLAGQDYTYNAQVSCSAGNRTIPHGASSYAGNSYGYDCNGNMTTRTIGTTTYTLTYDAENRMTAVSGGGLSASFVYDGDGNRVKGTVNGAMSVYIGNHFEWSGSTSTMQKYYYAGGVRVAMREGSGDAKWLLSDHLGSSTVTASFTGSRLAELAYGAWGETRYTYGTTPTTYRYTGQRQEKLLGGLDGLYFYNARWYDPSLSRWIQPDTLVPAAVQGVQAWDRYAYVNNNPIRYNDPTGHCIGPLLLVCVGVALIGAAVSIATINTGIEQVAWASPQREIIAQEQAAAQQWQDNCMGQCHYADSVSPTPNVTVGGSRPETPVSDTLGSGYYNIAQGTIGLVGNIVGLTGLGLSAAQQARAAATSSSQYLDDLANDIGDWVGNGEGVRGLRNSDGDFLLINDSNTRLFRFDYYDPSPHQNPHMHLLEWFENRKWDGPRIFPKDVDPR